jgi:hypothetical protein
MIFSIKTLSIECRSAKYSYVELYYVECHDTECLYAECRGTSMIQAIPSIQLGALVCVFAHDIASHLTKQPSL